MDILVSGKRISTVSRDQVSQGPCYGSGSKPESERQELNPGSVWIKYVVLGSLFILSDFPFLQL